METSKQTFLQTTILQLEETTKTGEAALSISFDQTDNPFDDYLSISGNRLGIIRFATELLKAASQETQSPEEDYDYLLDSENKDWINKDAFKMRRIEVWGDKHLKQAHEPIDFIEEIEQKQGKGGCLMVVLGVILAFIIFVALAIAFAK